MTDICEWFNMNKFIPYLLKTLLLIFFTISIFSFVKTEGCSDTDIKCVENQFICFFGLKLIFLIKSSTVVQRVLNTSKTATKLLYNIWLYFSKFSRGGGYAPRSPTCLGRFAPSISSISCFRRKSTVYGLDHAPPLL